MWAHGLANAQSVQIIYGYTTPLDLDFTAYSDYGDPANIYVRAFARTDDTQNGMTVRMTLTDMDNTSWYIDQVVGYYGNTIAKEIEWNVNTYAANGVDITSIKQMSFSLLGLKTDGDAYFGVLEAGAVPEPGTTALIGLASIIIYSARKKRMMNQAHQTA